MQPGEQIEAAANDDYRMQSDTEKQKKGHSPSLDPVHLRNYQLFPRGSVPTGT